MTKSIIACTNVVGRYFDICCELCVNKQQVSTVIIVGMRVLNELCYLYITH
jgi:hypothetical protein